MSKLRETFLSQLADIYNAENQLTKALPKMAKAAEHEDLKSAFESHLEETEGHIERLEKVFKSLGEKVKSKTCKAMEGLIKEGKEVIDEEEGDAALICAAQKVEHYEIAGYGSLLIWAKLLGETEAAKLLQETLNEEKTADETLTSVAQETVNADENEEEAEEKPKFRSK